MRGRHLVPYRWQSMSELSYEFIANMIREQVGPDGRPYFPFIFALFMFILLGNLLGMVPYSYTFTSQIIVTFAMAMVVRSEEHTSELQSLMRISYAVFCLKKQTTTYINRHVERDKRHYNRMSQ